MALKSADAYRSLLSEPNVQRALETIKAAEGTARREDPYSVGFGFTTLPDLDSHPGQSLSRSFTAKGRRNSSSAAGAYQFMDRTWSEMAPKLGLKDFSPLSQDIAALAKIDERGALDDVLKGDVKGFARAVANEWASFPGNKYGQKQYKQAQIESYWDEGLKPAEPGLPPGSRMLAQTPPNFPGMTIAPPIANVPAPQFATRGLSAPVAPVSRMALGPVPGQVPDVPVPSFAPRAAAPVGAAQALDALAKSFPTPSPAPRPQAAPPSMTPMAPAPQRQAPAAAAPVSGLPTKAAPLPDAVSYGLMAESLKSRGVMGLDGRMAANQPTSLPSRTAPSVPTPTSRPDMSLADRMAGFPQGTPVPTRAPERPQSMMANVPTPSFADRLGQAAAAQAPSNFAGPAGSFRAAQAPSPMAEMGSRVAPVSVAERMGLPSTPTPTPAPRGMMGSIADAVVSPAKASTMPDLSSSVRDRMGGFNPMQAVDMAGYRAAPSAPASPATRVAEAAPRGATGSWGPQGATGSWAAPAPAPAPSRQQMTSPRAMESLGAPSLDNFAMPSMRPDSLSRQATPSVPSAPQAPSMPAPAPQAPTAPDFSNNYAPTRSPNDPLEVAERVTDRAMSRGYPSAPEAPAAPSSSFMSKAVDKVGGLGGLGGAMIGGAVAGPVGAMIGGLVGKQLGPAFSSSNGNHGTGTRSSAAEAALNAGWSGFGPMTAAQERAARNAGSSSRGGGGWSNDASSSAIGGRTTSYSDGRTEKDGRSGSGGGHTGGLF